MIAVSMCLLGVNCAYSGGNNAHSELIELFRRGEVVPVCPEQLGGLSTPRAPSEIKNSRVINIEGEDVTEAFQTGAEEALKLVELSGCKQAVLKARSPSCGCDIIYDGSFSGKTINGDGVFTGLLKRRGVTVMTEESLSLLKS